MEDNINIGQNGGSSFTGQKAVNVFRLLALKSGLGLYLKTGMKPNRLWAPSKMVAAVTRETGKTYKRGRNGQEQALADLIALIDSRKPMEGITVTHS